MVGVIDLSAMYVDDDVVGVQAGAYVIPTVLPRLLGQLVGGGHNADGIAWRVDQRDFGAPEFFAFEADVVEARAPEALSATIYEHLLPALDRMLGPGVLYARIRAAVVARSPFEGPHALVQAVAVLLDDRDADLAMTAVRWYASSEATKLAEYTSKPWQLQTGLTEKLLILREAFSFPSFDPVAAAADVSVRRRR